MRESEAAIIMDTPVSLLVMNEKVNVCAIMRGVGSYSSTEFLHISCTWNIQIQSTSILIY